MKFLFGDNVKVIDGFFKDAIGTVMDTYHESHTNRYQVEMTKKINNHIIEKIDWVYEKQLELI